MEILWISIDRVLHWKYRTASPNATNCLHIIILQLFVYRATDCGLHWVFELIGVDSDRGSRPTIYVIENRHTDKYYKIEIT